MNSKMEDTYNVAFNESRTLQEGDNILKDSTQNISIKSESYDDLGNGLFLKIQNPDQSVEVNKLMFSKLLTILSDDNGDIKKYIQLSTQELVNRLLKVDFDSKKKEYYIVDSEGVHQSYDLEAKPAFDERGIYTGGTLLGGEDEHNFRISTGRYEYCTEDVKLVEDYDENGIGVLALDEMHFGTSYSYVKIDNNGDVFVTEDSYNNKDVMSAQPGEYFQDPHRKRTKNQYVAMNKLNWRELGWFIEMD